MKERNSYVCFIRAEGKPSALCGGGRHEEKTFKAALPHTLPICVGFLFLGMSYGFMMRSKDNNSEYYHYCQRGSGNHGHPFSAIPYFPRRQRASCIYPSSWEGASICGNRPSDRVLPEGSAHKRNLWAARSHCDFVYRIFA